MLKMSWHAGNSLAQTIFTCMYLHQIIDLTQHNFEAFHQAYPVRHHGVETHINGGTPNDPPGEFVHLVLKAYLVGLLRCCYHVWEEMSKGNLYEEEDFVTHRFGLSLLDDISDSTVLNLLDDAEYWLSTAGTDWMTSRNMQSTCKALSVRIRLRKVGADGIKIHACSRPVLSIGIRISRGTIVRGLSKGGTTITGMSENTIGKRIKCHYYYSYAWKAGQRGI